TRRNVAVIVDTPGANRFSTAAVDNHTRLRIDTEIAGTRHLATRPANYSFRGDITTGSAIENQKSVIQIDDQKIMERINGYGRFVTDNLRIGPFENSFWRHVAVRLPVKHENRGQSISGLASNVT